MKILAADDDSVTRLLIERISIKAGLDISTVESGNEILEACAHELPDILVLDWVMPGISGVEVARRIHETYENDAPYILMVTGRSRPEDLEVALEAGANDYLHKPFGPAELKARLSIAQSHVLRERVSNKNYERAQKAERLEAMGSLAQGVAHDFSNIFGPILAYSQMLQKAKGDEESQQKRLDAIQRSCARGMNLVHQISTYTAIERTPREKCSISQLAETFLALCERKDLPAPLNFAVEDNDVCFTGALSLLAELLLNLYSNALRVCEGNQELIFLKLGISTRHGRQRLRLECRDYGPGIQEGVKELIFQPFFTTEERTKGTGMGLAVVDGIVRAHRGEVSVHSEVGLGARFEVWIPLRGATSSQIIKSVSEIDLVDPNITTRV